MAKAVKKEVQRKQALEPVDPMGKPHAYAPLMNKPALTKGGFSKIIAWIKKAGSFASSAYAIIRPAI